MANSYNLFSRRWWCSHRSALISHYCSYWQIIDMRPFHGISNQKYERYTQFTANLWWMLKIYYYSVHARERTRSLIQTQTFNNFISMFLLPHVCGGKSQQKWCQLYLITFIDGNFSIHLSIGKIIFVYGNYSICERKKNIKLLAFCRLFNDFSINVWMADASKFTIHILLKGP